MAMNSTDWQEVQQRLESLYTSVDLDCDGYRLTLCLNRLTQFKNAIVVYVDGWVRGAWLLNDCEERRRFMCPRTTRLYRKKDFKGFSKASFRRLGLDPDKTLTVYSHTWKSFGALRRHLERNNKEITLTQRESEAAA